MACDVTSSASAPKVMVPRANVETTAPLFPRVRECIWCPHPLNGSIGGSAPGVLWVVSEHPARFVDRQTFGTQNLAVTHTPATNSGCPGRSQGASLVRCRR